jgi:hypothetical protein
MQGTADIDRQKRKAAERRRVFKPVLASNRLFNHFALACGHFIQASSPKTAP